MSLVTINTAVMEAKEAQIQKELEEYITPGITVQQAVQIFEREPVNLLRYFEDNTAEDQSPWLKSNVLALFYLYVQEDVGLAIEDYSHYILDSNSRDPNYPWLKIENYTSSRLFSRFADENGLRPYPNDVMNREKLKDTAVELAAGIGSIRGNENFCVYDLPLLAGCNLTQARNIIEFLMEQGYLVKVDSEEYDQMFKIANLNPDYFGIRETEDPYPFIGEIPIPQAAVPAS